MEIKSFSAKNKVKDIMEDLLFTNEMMEQQNENENREEKNRVNWHIKLATKKLEDEIEKIKKELKDEKEKEK